MREIKFRAWAQEDPWDESDSPKHVMCYDLAFEDYEPINELLAGVENLMQFTGLKDKNGREIWEGDIIRESHHHGDDSGHDIAHGAIVFERGSFLLNLGKLGKYPIYDRVTDMVYRQWRVIGNIHEDPELTAPS